MASQIIEISHLSKEYPYQPSKQIVFQDFDLTIKEGDRVGLFGENGTGKTTLLNIIAGVEKDFSGSVSVKGKRLSYMHQDTVATLAPWFTCEKNILLIREYHRLNLEKGRVLLKELSKELGVSFSLQKHPFMLSGGQRQLVALLRALVFEPDVLLLDEPFSNLDAQKREKVLSVLVRRFSELTILISSHRGDEVKSLINEAVILGGKPSKVARNILRSRENDFEQIIAGLNFAQAHEIEH